MGVSFYTSLYTDIKIHPSYEKYVLDKRNVLYAAIVCFEYIHRKKIMRKFLESSHLKIILFVFIDKSESFIFKAALLCIEAEERRSRLFTIYPKNLEISDGM